MFGSGSGNIVFVLIWVAALAIFFYFVGIRPQRKQHKERVNMISDMAPGDYVLTTSGFYGELVDVQDDTVIVEFGNNKNCRIAMKKDSIEQVEKASPYSKPSDSVLERNAEKDKKGDKKADKKAEKKG